MWRWRLRQRGHHRPLTSASARAELGRLLQKYGYDAVPIDEPGRLGYRTLTEPRFTAWLQTPFYRRPGEYAAVFLFVCVNLTVAISAAVVQALRWHTMFAHVDMNSRGRLAAAHTLVVSGGITEYYLRDQLWHWTRDLERVRDEVRKQARLQSGLILH